MYKILFSTAAAIVLGCFSFNYSNAEYTEHGFEDFTKDIAPYIGADFKYWRITNDDANNFFRENYYGGSLYMGAIWCEMVGLELGYDAADRKNRNTFSNGTDVLAGESIAQNTNILTKIQIRGPYLDLNGYFGIYNSVDLIGTIGVAHIDPKTDIFVGGTNRIANGRSKSILRAGTGFRFIFTDYIGIRALIRWENMNRIKVKLNNSSSVQTEIKPFDDAVSVSMGLIVTFV